MCNDGYIFIRGSTCITLDMVSGQTGGYGWVCGMGGMGAVCLFMGMGGMGTEMVK